MQKTYPPSEVHAMTNEDLLNLAGVYVVVECWATPEERGYYDSNWVGGSGLCTTARRREDGTCFIMWDYGMGWQWTPDAQVYLSVCDGKTRNHDHGVDHNFNDAAVKSCLAHLGARLSMSLEEAQAKYGR